MHNFPLYEFQKKGVEFLLSNPMAALCDEPGCGKTIQTLSALDKDPYIQSILILCPNSLKFSWAAEIEKWVAGPYQVIDGGPQRRAIQWARTGYFRFTICNYEAILRDKSIMPRVWDAIVCDEATRISNSRTQTFKVLWALRAKRKIALTGTPVQNSPIDLFGIISWLTANPVIGKGILGNFWQFRNTYCVLEPRFNRIVGFKNLATLAERVAPYVLRRLKAEVLKDLPPRTVQEVVFDLSDNERELYDNIRTELVDKKDDLSKNLGMALVKMLRLKEVADDWRLLKSDGTEGHRDETLDLAPASKLAALKELIEPIKRSGEKVIIFTQFSRMARILEKEINGSVIDGDVPSKVRQSIVQMFNEASGADGVNSFYNPLVMTEAGAFGLNIQGASYIIHYDLPWSVGKYEQRIGRAHRIGQDKPVTVYNLIARNTIDEYCWKVLKRKYKISNDLLSDDDRLEDAGLSEEDIKAILNL